MPYPFQDDDFATVALHVASCEFGTLDEIDIGSVAHGWVGPYILRDGSAPDGGTTLTSECFTDSAIFLAWLQGAGVPCSTGRIDVSIAPTIDPATHLIAFETQSTGKYSSTERSHLASGAWNFEIHRVTGVPGNDTVITQNYQATDLGMVTAGGVEIEGGYLGSISGRVPFLPTSTSQGLGATMVFEVRSD